MIAAVLVATAVVVLGVAACVRTTCDLLQECPCSDGTTQTTLCGEPATCQDACDSHGGACPNDFFDGCQCSCDTVTHVAFSNCTVSASTCEAACEQLGGVADAGAFDGSCPPSECSKETLSPAEVLQGDGGYVSCFCSRSCGCFATPDGGAPCPQ